MGMGGGGGSVSTRDNIDAGMRSAQDSFRAWGAACPHCGTTRHYHGTRDNGPSYPAHLRYEPLFVCWRCAYDGQSMRIANMEKERAK